MRTEKTDLPKHFALLGVMCCQWDPLMNKLVRSESYSELLDIVASGVKEL